MTTIDDLILEGEQFNIKHKPGYIEPAGFGLLKQVSSVSYLPNADKFATWVQKCIRFIAQNFPDDIALEDFKNIVLEDLKQGTIYKLVGTLKALKENPIICKPQIQLNSMNTITVTQSQNQTQTNSLILDSLREELKGKEYNEIEEILSSNSSKEEKRNNIISRLKGFGENVAASIVATLLTNGLS